MNKTHGPAQHRPRYTPIEEHRAAAAAAAINATIFGSIYLSGSDSSTENRQQQQQQNPLQSVALTTIRNNNINRVMKCNLMIVWRFVRCFLSSSIAVTASYGAYWAGWNEAETPINTTRPDESTTAAIASTTAAIASTKRQ